jgi:hypothetical protein
VAPLHADEDKVDTFKITSKMTTAFRLNKFLKLNAENFNNYNRFI